MRYHRLLGFSAVTAFSLLLGHGIAAAQAGSAPPSPPLTLTLTLDAQLAKTESDLSRMETTRQTIRKMLETARSRRDPEKTTCLNDKLNQVDVALRSARERRQSLELAAKRKDTDLANHEFATLTILRQRADTLMAEANLCVDKDTEPIEESGRRSSVDPGLPNEDPSEYPIDPIIIEPPGCASCFK